MPRIVCVAPQPTRQIFPEAFCEALSWCSGKNLTLISNSIWLRTDLETLISSVFCYVYAAGFFHVSLWYITEAEKGGGHFWQLEINYCFGWLGDLNKFRKDCVVPLYHKWIKVKISVSINKHGRQQWISGKWLTDCWKKKASFSKLMREELHQSVAKWLVLFLGSDGRGAALKSRSGSGHRHNQERTRRSSSSNDCSLFFLFHLLKRRW